MKQSKPDELSPPDKDVSHMDSLIAIMRSLVLVAVIVALVFLLPPEPSWGRVLLASAVLMQGGIIALEDGRREGRISMLQRATCVLYAMFAAGEWWKLLTA